MKSFSDNNGRHYACVLLDGKETYPAWAFTLREHLTTAGLLEFVINEPTASEEKGMTKATDEQLVDARKAQEAKSIILSTIKQGEVVKILHCKTTYEMWTHFARAYGLKTSNAKVELSNELQSFRCASAADVPMAVNKILAIRGKLTEFKLKLDDAVIMSSIMASLPETFSTFLES